MRTFHYAPPKGWISDPNGLVYFQGYYHVFFQHAPDYEIPWQQPMHWGHARTRDFLHWETLPVALCPDGPFDDKGCWSGTALVKDDTLYLFYASLYTPEGAPEALSTVSIATSRDGVHFEKHPQNPVIAHFPPEGSSNFRDPAICKAGDSYFCVMATGHEETREGRLLLYESSDLSTWALRSILHSWPNCKFTECPSLVPLGDQWLLGVSVCPTDAPHHFHLMLGDLKDHAFHTLMESGVDLGPDQYAGQIFPAPDGRALMITWVPGWRYFNGAYKPHVGCMSIPREISVKNGKLCAWPAREVQHLITHSDPAVERTQDGFIIRRTKREDVVFKGEIRDMAILRDDDVIEIFLNGGETVYTVLLC